MSDIKPNSENSSLDPSEENAFESKSVLSDGTFHNKLIVDFVTKGREEINKLIAMMGEEAFKQHPLAKTYDFFFAPLEQHLRPVPPEQRIKSDLYVPPLPRLRRIKELLRDLQKGTDTWTFMDLNVKDYDAFQEIYGKLAGGYFLGRFTTQLAEIIDQFGTPEDVIGELGENHIVIITYSEKAEQLEEAIINRFNQEVIQHYSPTDRKRKYIVLSHGEKHPLMTLMVQSTQQFPIEGIDLT